MPSSDGIGTRFGLLVRSQGYNVLPPHMLSLGSIGTRSGLGNASSEPPPHIPPSDGIGTRSGPSVRLQIQGSSYHIKSCFKGNSWYEITNKEGNKILPSHLQGGPWFQTYQGVKAANNLPLFARLMQVMCNHAPIGEYRVRFFSKEPYKSCQCDLKSPETRQHLLMVCPVLVRQINHYNLDGITTIRSLILFLQDNLQAFSFVPPELPQHADESWLAYRRELELAREEENKRRKERRLPPLEGPIFLHESIEFVRHWNVWEINNGWRDIFCAMMREIKPVSQAVLKRGRRRMIFFYLVYERFCFFVYLSVLVYRFEWSLFSFSVSVLIASTSSAGYGLVQVM
ncbi:hypothetical protein Agabi119p4_10614 [Agaricus bisporus var. burnettii]|uniref:Uncharacterized protein n=1 Tax=Agaricus bisporus var. burnettii TaxID=192524 RepID=A0A8H7C397_AGABI|nr:hypothetical protein Agabi119p4_10614 [Agaricus bisporus var. burnettii]